MGSLERRLEALEAAFVEAQGQDADDEARRRLFREAYRRLSIVEMTVLTELHDAYRSRPDVSPAELWHELTDAQRHMEHAWRRAVAAAVRDAADADGPLSAQEGAKREAELAVANHPFSEGWQRAQRGHRGGERGFGT